MPVEVGRGKKLPGLLAGVERLFIPFASRAIALSLNRLLSLISPYPPQPPRNRGKKLNTYVRGVGFYPRSAFVADSEQPGGYRVKRAKKATIRYTSEQMDKRYVQKVKATGNGVEGTLQNTASYSGWVIGSKDANEVPHQQPYHTETGWPNKDDTLEAVMPFINEQRDKAVNELMSYISNGGK
jgi:hypothetical protein